MGMKRAKALLKRTAIELMTGKELIRKRKKKLKKAKDPLIVRNTKLELEAIQKAVDGIQDHRKLLKDELATGSGGERTLSWKARPASPAHS